MADYEALTALIDFYGLKKEGKVAVVDKTPGLVGGRGGVVSCHSCLYRWQVLEMVAQQCV